MSETCLRVRYVETDAMKVAHHASYLSWFEVARVQLMDDLGCSYKKIESLGLFSPVLELSIKYKKSAVFDDRILIKTFLKNMPRARYILDYEVFAIDIESYDEFLTNIHKKKLNESNFNNNSFELIAQGQSVHGFINSKGSPQKPPDCFLNILCPFFKE